MLVHGIAECSLCKHRDAFVVADDVLAILIKLECPECRNMTFQPDDDVNAPFEKPEEPQGWGDFDADDLDEFEPSRLRMDRVIEVAFYSLVAAVVGGLALWCLVASL
jgi:hypothetical protein